MTLLTEAILEARYMAPLEKGGDTPYVAHVVHSTGFQAYTQGTQSYKPFTCGTQHTTYCMWGTPLIHRRPWPLLASQLMGLTTNYRKFHHVVENCFNDLNYFGKRATLPLTGTVLGQPNSFSGKWRKLQAKRHQAPHRLLSTNFRQPASVLHLSHSGWTSAAHWPQVKGAQGARAGCYKHQKPWI